MTDVDDLVYKSPNQHLVGWLEQDLIATYECTVGDWNWFLGINIVYNREEGYVKFSQEAFIDQLIERFGLEDQPGVDTPFVVGSVLGEVQPGTELSPTRQRRYMEMVSQMLQSSSFLSNILIGRKLELRSYTDRNRHLCDRQHIGTVYADGGRKGFQSRRPMLVIPKGPQDTRPGMQATQQADQYRILRCQLCSAWQDRHGVETVEIRGMHYLQWYAC